MSPFFTSFGQSIGASASASVLPMNIQDWFPLRLTGLISLQPKELSRVLQHHSSKASILGHSAFFMVQFLHPHMLLLLLLSHFSRVRLCETPERAAHPWGFRGKSTGVECHFLLQCMKLKSESEVAQLCPTPSDPMDCSLPGSSIHGVFQARVLEWGATAFSTDVLYLCVIQAPLSMGFSRREYWSRVPLPSPTSTHNY